MFGLSSRLRERLGLGGHDDAVFSAMTDRSIMARALMYLLAAVGTAVVASIAVPSAPLAEHEMLPVAAAIAYAGAIGVLFGFERLAQWGVHALLLSVTALIAWAVHASGEAGSPYTIFFVWVALYAAFFFSARGAAMHAAAILAAYGVALVALDSGETRALHWAATASAILLLCLAIHALTARLTRVVDRLTDIGRADSLTGLPNAAAFSEILEREVERARRSGNRLGLIVAELDDFESVGSQPLSQQQRHLLASVGQVFRASPRQIDVAARLGGARFGLLLPYTDEHGAYLLAERLRERVRPVAAAQTRMSCGVAAFPRMGATAQALFQAAELALQEASEAGGDRVMLHQRAASLAQVEIELPEEQLS